MHSSHHNLDPQTHRVLHEEWRRLPAAARHGGPDSDATGTPHEWSPVIAVLPGLIRQVCGYTDHSIEHLRPTIKRLILEQLFMDVGGDAIVDTHHRLQVNVYVELTLRVLVRVRERELGEGEWSDTPVTPQMYG